MIDCSVATPILVTVSVMAFSSIEEWGFVRRISLHLEVPELHTRSSVSALQIDENTLIDAGSPRTAEVLFNELRNYKIEKILLTHQHEDHIGCLRLLNAKYHPQIFCPAYLLSEIAQKQPAPEYRELYWGSAAPYSGLIPFETGESWHTANTSIRSFATPGHTPGHESFLIESDELNILHIGDIYLSPRLFMAWVETSVPDMITSLKKAAQLARQHKALVVPSHGKILNNAPQKLEKLAEWYEAESKRILDTAEKINSFDYHAIFSARYNSEYNFLEKRSKGELSRLCLIRGVIDPVKTLPADPVAL